jgi:hypothetical protein
MKRLWSFELLSKKFFIHNILRYFILAQNVFKSKVMNLWFKSVFCLKFKDRWCNYPIPKWSYKISHPNSVRNRILHQCNMGNHQQPQRCTYTMFHWTRQFRVQLLYFRPSKGLYIVGLSIGPLHSYDIIRNEKWWNSHEFNIYTLPPLDRAKHKITTSKN